MDERERAAWLANIIEKDGLDHLCGHCLIVRMKNGRSIDLIITALRAYAAGQESTAAQELPASPEARVAADGGIQSANTPSCVSVPADTGVNAKGEFDGCAQQPAHAVDHESAAGQDWTKDAQNLSAHTSPAAPLPPLPEEVQREIYSTAEAGILRHAGGRYDKAVTAYIRLDDAERIARLSMRLAQPSGCVSVPREQANSIGEFLNNEFPGSIVTAYWTRLLAAAKEGK